MQRSILQSSISLQSPGMFPRKQTHLTPDKHKSFNGITLGINVMFNNIVVLCVNMCSPEKKQCINIDETLFTQFV